MTFKRHLLRFRYRPAIRIFWVVLGGLGPTGVIEVSAQSAPANHLAGEIRFDRDVKPILAHHCFKCHGRGREKGGLKMDSRELFLSGGDSGPMVTIGDAAQSRLLKIVSGDDPDLAMPPRKDGNTPLSGEQIDVLRRWINQGVDWTDERMNKPYTLALRAVSLPSGEGHPIDRLLAPYFARHGVTPASPVDDGRFARRAFLDLTGLPPTPEELESFIRDSAPGKRERLAGQLLERHEAFVAHWMPFWMDHLRIGSSLAAGIFDNDASAKPLRWLEGELKAGVAYDRFVRGLIAGPVFEDFAQSIAPRAEVANAQGRPEMQVAQILGQTFLGVRLQCASCHDSFVDRWKLRESWGVASALGSESLEMARCEIATGERAPPAFLFPELGSIDASLPAAGRRARLAELMTSPQNGLFARTIVNRMWARLFGRGLIEPVDEMVEHESWHPDLLDWLAAEFIRQEFDLKRLLRLIVTSQAYQLPPHGVTAVPTGPNLPEKKEAGGSAAGPDHGINFQGPLLRRLTAEQFIDILQMFDSPVDGAPRPRAWQQANDPLLRSLGRPDRNTVVTSRSAEFSALQAFEWMNGDRLEALLQSSARAIVRRGPAAPDSLVNTVCVQLLGRRPVTNETEKLLRIVGTKPTADSVADLLWVLIMLPEFHFIR